jgi:hypothetical protein
MLHKPGAHAWLVPRTLPDSSISSSPGSKLSYFGYQFELPWTDIDDARTKSSPHSVVLTFHSGLMLIANASPPALFRKSLEKSAESEARVEQSLGVHSEYALLAVAYALTPDKVHSWVLSPRLHYREMLLLHMKSMMLRPEAETGFYYVGSSAFKGFQQGDPQAWTSNNRPKSRSAVLVELFSDQAMVNLILFQNNYGNQRGISQADVNRIIQSLHKVDEKNPVTNAATY